MNIEDIIEGYFNEDGSIPLCLDMPTLKKLITLSERRRKAEKLAELKKALKKRMEIREELFARANKSKKRSMEIREKARKTFLEIDKILEEISDYGKVKPKKLIEFEKALIQMKTDIEAKLKATQEKIDKFFNE